jgi:hypothetical protein
MKGQIFFQILVQRFSDLAHARQFQHSIQVKRPSPEAIPVATNSTRNYLRPMRLEKGIPPQLQQLLDLLSISTFYDFGLVREYAIRAIEANFGLDPIDKICYANQCDIPEWLFTAYKELSRRSAPLEVSEAERIGLTTAILVAKARERIIRDQSSQNSGGVFGSRTPEEDEMASESVDAIVNSVFFGKKN